MSESCCDQFENAIVCVGGPILEIIDRNGKRWRFEMHRVFGPNVVVGRHDDIADKQPPEQSPFWHCVQLWCDQGEKLADDGLCAWMFDPEKILRHLGGKHYEIVGYEPAKHGWPQPPITSKGTA